MNNLVTFSQLGRYGRFGNQVYQIASTIGIARNIGAAPVFPRWINHDHTERFGSKEDNQLWSYFENQLPAIPEGVHNFSKVEMPWGYHKVPLPEGNIDLNGHMQAPKYFEPWISEVRFYMKMKAEPSIHLKAIALHARRGDYDNKYHPVLPIGYYVTALEIAPKNVPILVFSDDPNFCKELYDALTAYGAFFTANRLQPITQNYINSYAIMKKCCFFIIGNSTYSASAATLCSFPGKEVIASKTWFGSAYTNITAKDIYEKNWVVL